MKQSSILVLGLTLWAQAYADYQGTMVVSEVNKEGKETVLNEAQIMRKGTMQRVESKRPMPMTMIMDTKKGEGIMLMPAQKMAMKTKMGQHMVNMGQMEQDCKGSDLQQCYEKKGFKKLGQEKVQDMDCEIYGKENMKDGKKKDYVKVWHIKDDKESLPLKIETYEEEKGKLKGKIEFKNFKKASLSDDLFKVPEGYNMMDMPSMPGMPGGMKGGMPSGMKGGMPGMPKMPKTN